VYSLRYHIVWCTKYRKQIFVSGLEEEVKKHLQEIADTYPVLYRDNMYERTGEYTARIKVWIRNTWDWMDIRFRKSDADYITRHCPERMAFSPTVIRKSYRYRPVLFFFLAYLFTWIFWIPAIFTSEDLGAGLMLIGLIAPAVVSTVWSTSCMW
jgi:hypothetical protein